MINEIGNSVPESSLDFWAAYFNKFNVSHENISEGFGKKYLPFRDPDGLKIKLIFPNQADNRKPWKTDDVKAVNNTRGFYKFVLTLRSIEPTAEILTDVFGYSFLKKEGNRFRYATDAVENAAIVDLLEAPELAGGNNLAGTNHHVAFRVKDEAILMEYRENNTEHRIEHYTKNKKELFLLFVLQ